MSHNRFKILLIGVFFIFLSGCEVSEDDGNKSGNGSFSLYAYKKINPDIVCPTGGVAFYSGNDSNANLRLESNEINEAINFCNDTYNVTKGSAASFSISNNSVCNGSGYKVEVLGSVENVCNNNMSGPYVLPKRLPKDSLVSVENYIAKINEYFYIHIMLPMENNLPWFGSIVNLSNGDLINTSKVVNKFSTPNTEGVYNYLVKRNIILNDYSSVLKLDVVNKNVAYNTSNDGVNIRLKNSSVKLLSNGVNYENLNNSVLLTDSISDFAGAFTRYNLSSSFGSVVTTLALEIDNIGSGSVRDLHEKFINRLSKNLKLTDFSNISTSQPNGGFLTYHIVRKNSLITPTELASQILIAGLDDSPAQTFTNLPNPMSSEKESGKFKVFTTSKMTDVGEITLIIQVVRDEDFSAAEGLMSIGSSPNNIIKM